MHDGCSGTFENGKEVADKVRMMGFDRQPMPLPLTIECTHCGSSFEMETYSEKCECGMVYAVTPCHAFDPANVMAAGLNY
jgi:hypothetical protein